MNKEEFMRNVRYIMNHKGSSSEVKRTALKVLAIYCKYNKEKLYDA